MRTIVLCLAAFLITASGVFAVDRRAPNDVVSHLVDPLRPDQDYLENLHPKPFIAISQVTPPTTMCMADKCWPAVFYFADNPDPKLELKITVECSAFSAHDVRLATASNWVIASPGSAVFSIVVLEGADYRQFGRVDCRVVGFEPS